MNDEQQYADIEAALEKAIAYRNRIAALEAELQRCVELLEDLEPGHSHRTMISDTVREARRVLRGRVD